MGDKSKDGYHSLRIDNLQALVEEDQSQQKEASQKRQKQQSKKYEEGRRQGRATYQATYQPQYRRQKRIAKKANELVQTMKTPSGKGSKTPGGEALDAFNALVTAKSASKSHRQQNTARLAKKMDDDQNRLAKKMEKDERENKEDDAALMDALNMICKYKTS